MIKKRKFDTHMNAVHYKIKPYKCRYGCSIAYGELGNRNSHEKKKHGGLACQRKTQLKEIN